MPDITEDLKRRIVKKMFQVCSLAFNVTNALNEEHQSSLLDDLSEIRKCCSDAATAFKSMQTTYPAEQHAQQKSDVHTEHCCKLCGCKYGDVGCSVTSSRKKQTNPCKGECSFYF